MPPKVLAKNNDRAGGVLPVNAATRAAANKGPAPKLKLIARRLPPGLTLGEFEETLGEEWKPGSGKVEWREFCGGKVKQGNHPQQARCYLLVTNEPLIAELDKHFRTLTFHDKAGTYKLPELRNWPPALEWAPNQRTPMSVKQRADPRQGTIDQDPEYMAFLEGETQATEKPAPLDAVGVEKEKTEKVEVKSTPLIDSLREKKANKAKAAESKNEEKKSKGHARGDSKDTAASKKDAKEDKQQNVQQASKEAVKALNKQVASKQQQAQQRPASPQQPQGKNASPAKSKKAANSKAQSNQSTEQGTANAKGSAPASAPQAPASQREPRARPQRGGAGNEGIKKMLQKDLGIKPKQGGNAKSSQAAAASPSASGTPTETSGNADNKNSKSKDQNSSNPGSPAPNSTKGQNPPSVPKQQQNQATVSSTKAYLKHANPSQGMTEILIQQALSQYGELTNVTIDPRKGTAIALFKDNEGLKKAIEAKSVPVANGKIEVLEFKDRSGGSGRVGWGGRGGGGRGGRGGRHASNANSAAAAAPAATTKGDAGS